MESHAPERRGHARRLARNTAFFSFATGLSRVLGLAREVVAASYFGVTGAMSAFTIAFQVPNLVRALFADSALQGAFVPVFTELLEKGERREAFRRRLEPVLPDLPACSARSRRCSCCFAEPIMCAVRARLRRRPRAPGSHRRPRAADVPDRACCSRSRGWSWGCSTRSSTSACRRSRRSPGTLVIIAALVGLVPLLPEDDEIYAYAIGVLAGTVVQFLLPLPWLRGRGGRLHAQARLARPARAARAQADAAGHDRARADQPQPADQLAVRHARLRRRRPPPSTRRFASTSCRRGSSRSRSPRSCSPRSRASRRAAPATTCAARWPTASARSACCSSRAPC